MSQMELILVICSMLISVLVVVQSLINDDNKDRAVRVLIFLMLTNVLMSAFVILCDYLEGGFRLGAITTAIVYFANMMIFLLQYLMVMELSLFMYYLICRYSGKDKRLWLIGVWFLLGICILGLFLNYFNSGYYYIDHANIYQIGSLADYQAFLTMFALAVTWLHFIRNNKSLPKLHRRIMPFYFGPPIVGIIIDAITNSTMGLNSGITFTIMLIYYTYEKNIRIENQRQTEMLLQSRAYLLNSQIRPHFMFNALSVIQALIFEDPELASDAISHLSLYLRKELNLKSVESTIPVREELDYVEHYLYIEKLRFGDKVKVEYDLDGDLDFGVPFLSIQPLVENAVRHGIRKKLGGGTVRIRVAAESKYHVIEVSDDGIGMEIRDNRPIPKSAAVGESLEGNGVGLENVIERIRILCNGTVEFRSEIGKGTTIIIKIPMES